MPAPQRDVSTQAHLDQFGKTVRLLRHKKEMSQETLAHTAGLHRTVVGKVERGEREIGIGALWPLAQALGVEIADLFSQ